MAKHLSEKQRQWSKEYSHQRRRLRQAVKRQQAKGFDISLEELIPARPIEFSEGYIQHLKNLTPEFIRTKSIHKTEQKKSAEEMFEEARRVQDKRALTILQQDAEFAERFSYGVLAMEELT